MKRNHLVIVITILLIIIAVVLVLNQRSSTLKQGASDFAITDTASVTRIFIVDKNNNSVLLERKSPSEWTVNKEHKAHTFQVNAMLKTMADLEVMSPVPKAARNNVISRLAASSKKVEIFQQGYGINLFNLIKLFPGEKLVKTYYVGGPTSDNLGTYMIMEGAEEPYIIFIPSFRGFVAAMYSPIEENWRDQTIFNTRLQDLRSLSMEFYEDTEESYMVQILNDEVIEFKPFTSNSPVAFDTVRMLEFLSGFSNIRYEALLNDKAEQSFIDSVLSLQPAHVISVIDDEGKETKVVTYRKGRLEVDPEDWPYDLNRLYGLINDGKDFVVMQYFVFDKVLRPASYFRPSE